ncbi:hypothetical protein EMCRGX_G006041 [Ephydatia muelleri]
MSILDHAVFASANGVSVIVCLLAAILVFRLKLYKTLVYRLALYQVLSALVMASMDATQNLKKLEVLYVVTSLLVPALIAIVPLVTHSYGRSPDGNICYIYANTSVAFIERLALWDGPAMVTLTAASIAMTVMVIKLASQVCRRSKYELITEGDQFWTALKQLLPLAIFPMLFFIFEIPVLIFHIHATQNSKPNEAMLIADAVCFSLWSTASGATVITHISHCATAFSMQNCAESAYQPYADEYH